jgi:ribosomal-protein-alanine N-acetyltransferase
MSYQMDDGLQFRPMTVHDIAEVHAIERMSFATPWSQQAFYQELTGNNVAQYIVCERAGKLLGYAGMWVMIDEAHMTNVAVHPDERGQKIGDQLLRQMMAIGYRLGAERITLEVRVSNDVARNLYKKYGFREIGMRKQYYSDKEDAIIMWADLGELNQSEIDWNGAWSE